MNPVSLDYFSWGGGVQSMAALVLGAQGKIACRAWLFCNVGADSENPGTLAYFEEVAKPFAAGAGLDLVELFKMRRDGSRETLMGRIKHARRSIPIPLRMSNGAPGRRVCTSDFKIKVIARYLRQHGWTADRPAVTGLGFSLDEMHRVRSDSGFAYQVLSYPLIDLRLTRQDCVSLISRANLPVPPKSSCFFCPFHSPAHWLEMRDQEPELFAQAVEVERVLNVRRGQLKKDQMWMHPARVPLDQAVGEQYPLWDEWEVCNIGSCMT